MKYYFKDIVKALFYLSLFVLGFYVLIYVFNFFISWFIQGRK